MRILPHRSPFEQRKQFDFDGQGKDQPQAEAEQVQKCGRASGSKREGHGRDSEFSSVRVADAKWVREANVDFDGDSARHRCPCNENAELHTNLNVRLHRHLVQFFVRVVVPLPLCENVEPIKGKQRLFLGDCLHDARRVKPHDDLRTDTHPAADEDVYFWRRPNRDADAEVRPEFRFWRCKLYQVQRLAREEPERQRRIVQEWHFEVLAFLNPFLQRFGFLDETTPAAPSCLATATLQRFHRVFENALSVWSPRKSSLQRGLCNFPEARPAWRPLQIIDVAERKALRVAHQCPHVLEHVVDLNRNLNQLFNGPDLLGRIRVAAHHGCHFSDKVEHRAGAIHQLCKYVLVLDQ